MRRPPDSKLPITKHLLIFQNYQLPTAKIIFHHSSVISPEKYQLLFDKCTQVIKLACMLHERSTAVIVSTTLIVCLFAPTSEYDVKYYENVAGEIRSTMQVSKVMRPSRFFARDFNLELGLVRSQASSTVLSTRSQVWSTACRRDRRHRRPGLSTRFQALSTACRRDRRRCRRRCRQDPWRS